MIRWLFLLRYPDHVTVDEGERWYLGVHTQEAKRMRHLVRYVSYPLERAPEFVADNPRFPDLNKWHRLTELAFPDWRSFRESAIDHPPRWTPPPYGWPGFVSETIFIGDRAEWDFLREIPLAYNTDRANS